MSSQKVQLRQVITTMNRVKEWLLRNGFPEAARSLEEPYPINDIEQAWRGKEKKLLTILGWYDKYEHVFYDPDRPKQRKD